MKKILFALLLPLTSFAYPLPGAIPDLPPDATSGQYRAVLQQRNLLLANDGLDPIFRMGERNLAWLEHMNSLRAPADKLSFTSKETQRGVPIETPSEYNPGLIQKKFADVKDHLPAEISRVIFDNAAFTDNPPIETKDYLDWSRALDRQYQSAARWRTMAPYLPYLEMARANDIRGYYFLSRLENRDEKLRGFYGLPEKDQTEIGGWLLSMCLNGGSNLNQCKQTLADALKAKGDMLALYQTFEPRSAATYQSFFSIPAYVARPDIRWESDASGAERLVAPFSDPLKADVQHFVQFNIQDEWKWHEWHLDLPFTTESGHPAIEFQPGVTPHVNRLGGDKITMNSNQPLTEYDAQWTIRHEYGHVLGLPDCYVEFYVSERQLIVNYQIDVENIMCSRKGHVKQENVDELKRVYKR